MNYTIQQIADHVRGEVQGDATLLIDGMEQLDRARPGQISFVRDAKHVAAWQASQATAALMQRDLDVAPEPGRALIRVADADVAVAMALELFAPPPPKPETGVHPSAVVDPTARLGAHVAVGPNAVIGRNAVIGDHTVIHANVTLFDEVVIGERCVIWSGTVIRERCTIGDRCILHPNVTIGADGFGYRPHPEGEGLVKIPQVGTVVLGNDVEIGASTCIDRGKFSATEIGDMTKIDNLCQIAHNCRIGRNVVMAGRCGLAGSVTVGDGVMFGGNVGVRDNVRIGTGAQLAAYAAVAEDVPDHAMWGGYPAQDARKALREVMAVRKLPDLMRELKQRK